MLAVMLPSRRHYLFAFLLGFALVLLGTLTSCRPHPKPPQPGDSTAVDTTAYDSAASAGDSLDGNGWVPDATADDTLPAPAQQSARHGLSVHLAGFSTAAASGLALGASGWPTKSWCSGPFTATNYGVAPEYLLPLLRLAQPCGFRLMGVVPRKLMTANGQPKGRFSVPKARAVFDTYRRLAPPDSVMKYFRSGTFLGWLVLDDMNCADCWGGQRITPEEAEQVYSYAKSIYPDMALGIRATPNWIKQRPSLSKYVDFAWAQYHTARGDINRYYDNAVRDAASLPYPVHLVMGVNIADCHGVGTSLCSETELRNFLGNAIDRPQTCASVSWKSTDDYRAQGRGAVWDDLLARARAKADVPSCGRS